MDFDVKNLEDAVLAFYQSNAKKKETTHEYLMQMQESPLAWQFAWDLMLPQKVCFPIVTEQRENILKLSSHPTPSPLDLRSAVLWRQHPAQEAAQTLSGGAEGGARTAQREAPRNHSGLLQWPQDGPQSAVLIRE